MVFGHIAVVDDARSQEWHKLVEDLKHNYNVIVMLHNNKFSRLVTALPELISQPRV